MQAIGMSSIFCLIALCTNPSGISIWSLFSLLSLDAPTGNSYHDLRPSLYHNYLANNASAHEQVCFCALPYRRVFCDDLRNVPCKR